MEIQSDIRPSPAYDIVFGFAYLSNVCMMSAVSLLFRYFDFIDSIGGDEGNLGWIVGLGACGAIAFRLFQGAAIDRVGAIRVWVFSLLGLALSLIWHIFIDNVNSWQVFAARLLMNTCIAGVFGAWLSFVSLRVGQRQVAEVIGVVGSSGFLGMAIGPVIGDGIFDSADSLAVNVRQMFLGSTFLILASVVCVFFAAVLNKTRLPKSKTGNRDTVFGLLRRFHPGFLLVVGAVMGLAISLPATFLRPFAETQGIEHIKVFFLTYNLVAFVSRLAFRKAPEVFGLRTTILTGLSFMVISMFLYLIVDSTYELIIPAIAAGLAHSFLFPSVVPAGTAVFPKSNRGVATSLILGMYDVGVVIGSPLAGVSIIYARSRGWSEYPTVFVLVGSMVALVAVSFWWRYRADDGRQLVSRYATKQ